MFTPIGFFAPQGGSIVTDGLQIWADPNLSTVSYTTGIYEGAISNLIGTGYNITFGNVTANPYNGSPKSFTVGTAAGGEKYFLPNGSHPYGNDSNADQGFVDVAAAFTTEAWVYFPTSTASPYYYNYEGSPSAVVYRWPASTPRALFFGGIFRRWSDGTNRYKYDSTFIRNNADVGAGTAQYPLGATQWNDASWHLWTVTSAGAGGLIKTYLDGVDQSIDIAQPAGVYTNTTLTYFGASGGGDYRVFQGGARGGAFRWYNRTLTSDEVLNNYNVENGTYGT